MISTNPIVFYSVSSLIIFFTLFTLFAKKIINSLLASVLVFFLAAVMFYILGSEYNAIIQAIIYGLAVPIVIGLSIMFTTGKTENIKSYKNALIIMTFGFAFLLFFIDSVIFSIINLPDTFNITGINQANAFNVLSAFAKGIFINYVLGFELISLMLTIVIAGIVLIKNKKSSI